MSITQAHRLLSEARAGTHCPSREEWIEIVEAIRFEVRENCAMICFRKGDEFRQEGMATAGRACDVCANAIAAEPCHSTR